MVATKKDYEELVKTGNEGTFPRVLTTDGINFSQEFRDNYDQWRADNTIISFVSNSDDWPTFRMATERRRAVKKRRLRDG